MRVGIDSSNFRPLICYWHAPNCFPQEELQVCLSRYIPETLRRMHKCCDGCNCNCLTTFLAQVVTSCTRLDCCQPLTEPELCLRGGLYHERKRSRFAAGPAVLVWCRGICLSEFRLVLESSQSSSVLWAAAGYLRIHSLARSCNWLHMYR